MIGETVVIGETVMWAEIERALEEFYQRRGIRAIVVPESFFTPLSGATRPSASKSDLVTAEKLRAILEETHGNTPAR